MCTPALSGLCFHTPPLVCDGGFQKGWTSAPKLNLTTLKYGELSAGGDLSSKNQVLVPPPAWCSYPTTLYLLLLTYSARKQRPGTP